ncbi:MAG: HD domain-containing phosphohydrolase [Idiomarina sp.]
MAEFISTDVEEHVMQELLDEIRELYQQCEEDIIALESDPHLIDRQQSLFRAIHTIKGDLGMVGFDPMISLLGAVEDLLQALRNGQLNYTNLLSDTIFIVLDQTLEFVTNCQLHGKSHYSHERQLRAQKLSHQVVQAQPDEQPSLLNQLIAALDPKLVLTEALDSPQQFDWQHDLRFFRELMASVESRSRYWHDRADRQLKMALLLNRFAGDIVDQRQLTAACYIHDFGMGFMPLEVLHQTTPLSANQRQLIKSHVYCSAKLLENMADWQSAKMMILQHHEQPDGNGYPLGLTDKEISDGAKILAIVDTFDALTHERANEQHTKRPIRRAVAEINRLAGTQLSSFWVTVFEQAMESLLQDKQET